MGKARCASLENNVHVMDNQHLVEGKVRCNGEGEQLQGTLLIESRDF